MKKPVSIETYEKMLAYQRWYYATMPDEQRAKYLERKKRYNALHRNGEYYGTDPRLIKPPLLTAPYADIIFKKTDT
jgi:hypothetical protein